MNAQSSIRCIFIHHSTGGDLVYFGDVRALFKAKVPKIDFWDQGYHPNKSGLFNVKAYLKPFTYGLRNGAGKRLAESIEIPRDNTDPDGLAELFNQTNSKAINNGLRKILDFDVIIFKSCFPVTAIKNDEQLDLYKKYYFSIRETIDKYPRKLFIPMTPPPLRQNRTTFSMANRARKFSQWVMSKEFCENRKNMIPYDLFDELATSLNSEQPNILRPEFCQTFPYDSHPNKLAHQTVAPKWVQFVCKACKEFFEL